MKANLISKTSNKVWNSMIKLMELMLNSSIEDRKITSIDSVSCSPEW